VAITVNFRRNMACCSRCGIVEAGESDCVDRWKTFSGERHLYALENFGLVPDMVRDTSDWHCCRIWVKAVSSAVLSHATIMFHATIIYTLSQP
jgi:hypothetical protein